MRLAVGWLYSLDSHKAVGLDGHHFYRGARFDAVAHCHGFNFVECTVDADLDFAVSAFVCRDGYVHRACFVERLGNPETVVLGKAQKEFDDKEEHGHKGQTNEHGHHQQQKFARNYWIEHDAGPAKSQEEVDEVAQRKELERRIGTVKVAVKIGIEAVRRVNAYKGHDGLYYKYGRRTNGQIP